MTVSAPVASAREAPPEIAAINVYVEMIPTSAGAMPLGVAAAPASGPTDPEPDSRIDSPLSPAAVAKVRAAGGADAPLLERVAVDPSLGAPQRIVPADLGEATSETSVTGVLGEGASRGAWLLAALALSTVAAAAARRRHVAIRPAPRRRER